MTIHSNKVLPQNYLIKQYIVSAINQLIMLTLHCDLNTVNIFIYSDS